MSWFSRKRGQERREEWERQHGLKTKTVVESEFKQNKLADAEEFKPAPLFMDTPPAATSKGELVPAKQSQPLSKPNSAPAPAKPATPAATPAATPVPVSNSAARPSVTKPAPAPVAKTVVVVDRLSPQEIAALKAKEATLESKVKSAQRAFRLKLQEDDLDPARKDYPAYAKSQINLIDEMVDCAEEREDASAAASYRRMIIEVRRDEPPAGPTDAKKLPQHKKPTLEQYLANPSRYGSTVAPKSSYKPTAADVAKQPFQAPKSTCSGYGYKAAENCKTCRAMADWVHCPCGCGSYIPIDRNYNPFGSEEAPSFKGGNPKGGF